MILHPEGMAGLGTLEQGPPALQSYPISAECLTRRQLSTRVIKLPCRLLKVACKDRAQSRSFLSKGLEISVGQERGVPTALP